MSEAFAKKAAEVLAFIICYVAVVIVWGVVRFAWTKLKARRNPVEEITPVEA